MKEEAKTISDAEIMKELLSVLRYSGLAFAKELEFKSHSSIHHILTGQNSISDSLVDKIVKKFPHVNYWYLKKGKLPIILEDKSMQVQANLFGSKAEKEKPDYNLEMFTTLKNIEKLLEHLVDVIDTKK
jgi:hypothetical protein